jgi:hypothetical protein
LVRVVALTLMATTLSLVLSCQLAVVAVISKQILAVKAELVVQEMEADMRYPLGVRQDLEFQDKVSKAVAAAMVYLHIHPAVVGVVLAV